MKRRGEQSGGLVVLEKPLDGTSRENDVSQGRRLFERTFLDENNGAPCASIGSHYDDGDVTPRVRACLSMIR